MADCVPPSWSIKADTLLTTLYKKTLAFDIDEFKRLNALTGFPVRKDSYDLVFVQSRLEELLGPYISETDPGVKAEPGVPAPTYLDKVWLKLEVEDDRGKHLHCTECNSIHPAIYVDVKTKQLRCGHCGNMDSSHLVEGAHIVPNRTEYLDPQCVEAAVQIGKPRARAECQHGKEMLEQSSSGSSAKSKMLPGDLDIPSARRPDDLPPNWNVFNDMILKKWYAKDPMQFDINGFKREIHLIFHGAPNMCMSPTSYDIVFLHNRLDKLIGPCICRMGKEDRANVGPADEPSFFHREWRAFKADDFGRRLYCDFCKVTPPLICRNERSREEYRCGSCGNSKIGRMPCDDLYNKHLNSIIESWRYILATRMEARLPSFPLEMVYSDIRKRMRMFEQERSDQPNVEHKPSPVDGQEKVRCEAESAQPEEWGGAKIKTEAYDD